MSALRKGRRRGKAPSKRAMRGRTRVWTLGLARSIAAWAHVARVAKQVGEQWAAIALIDAAHLAKGPT